MQVQALELGTGDTEAGDLWEFKASLVYSVSYPPASWGYIMSPPRPGLQMHKNYYLSVTRMCFYVYILGKFCNNQNNFHTCLEVVQAYKRNSDCTTEKVNEIISISIQRPRHVSARTYCDSLSSCNSLLLHPRSRSDRESSCANPTVNLSNSHITVAANLC